MKKYIQHSKKLATATLVSYFVLSFIGLVLLVLPGLDQARLETQVSVHGATTTLCGVVITGYMGNSSLEKYSSYKFKKEGPTTESETGENNG